MKVIKNQLINSNSFISFTFDTGEILYCLFSLTCDSYGGTAGNDWFSNQETISSLEDFSANNIQLIYLGNNGDNINRYFTFKSITVDQIKQFKQIYPSKYIRHMLIDVKELDIDYYFKIYFCSEFAKNSKVNVTSEHLEAIDNYIRQIF